MNEVQKTEVASALNAILASLQILSPLLVLVRDEIESRLKTENSYTKEIDVLVETSAGLRKAYATFHIEPDSGYAVMTELSTVTVEDMALAGDVLLRIQSHVDSVFDVINKTDARGVSK